MTRVAIQGVRGSYSEEAATKVFGADTNIVECLNFEATFAAVRQGDADHAVIPVVYRPRVQAIANNLRSRGSGWDSDFWNLQDWYKEA